MEKKTVCLKIGGGYISESGILENLALNIRNIRNDYNFVLIHGGGAEVSGFSQKIGLKPVFKDGIRLTTEEDMEIVDMILAGKVNKSIVRLFNRMNMTAVGISGSDGLSFIGISIEENSHTGRIINVNTDLISLIIKNGWIPIVSTTTMEKQGKALNVNADEAAFAVASALKSDMLIFLSDLPGVFFENEIINRMTAKDINVNINKGIISGGMIPKVKSSIEALKKGVRNIIIGNFETIGDMEFLLKGEKGTRIVLG